MSYKNIVLFAVWNVLLTGGILWLLAAPKGGSKDTAQPASAAKDSTVAVTPVPRDTAGLKNGRIAFFFMDTITSRSELVKARSEHVRGAGKQMKVEAQRKYNELMAKAQEIQSKDRHYTTDAENNQDEQMLAEIQQQLQELSESSQNSIVNLQNAALIEVTQELQSYLEDYNRTAGFDYIFSIQDGGQIWVGNKGLDITEDVVNGLNARYRAKKASAVAPPAKK